jgi:hypothetical protein
MSFFANGSWGADGSYHSVFAGLKYYIGPQKSLIRRQREDDPDVTLPLDLFHAPAAAQCVALCDGCCDSTV